MLAVVLDLVYRKNCFALVAYNLNKSLNLYPNLINQRAIRGRMAERNLFLMKKEIVLNIKKENSMKSQFKISIPVYEKRPDGLLLGRSELIVLALRCNEVVVFIAFESSWVKDDVLLFNRKPCRGDDGQDDVWRFWLIDSRDRDAFDFFRKIPCRVSALQTPFIGWTNLEFG